MWALGDGPADDQQAFETVLNIWAPQVMHTQTSKTVHHTAQGGTEGRWLPANVGEEAVEPEPSWAVVGL